MRLEVLLFGPQAALVGERSVVIESPGDTVTAAEVIDRLATAAPALADSIGVSRLAVNHEFVGDDHSLLEGDEVALIGMVSGG